MVGIAKQCRVCKAQFLTWSNKTTNVNMCDKCYLNRKTSSAVITANARNQAELVSLEDRIERIEKMDIDFLIQMQVNASLADFSSIDIVNRIEKQINKRVEETIAKLNKQFKTMRDKLQKQNVVLSNRILELEKEVKGLWSEEN